MRIGTVADHRPKLVRESAHRRRLRDRPSCAFERPLQVVRAADSMVVLVDTKTGRTWQRFVSTSVKAGQWEEITVEELAGKGK